MFDNLEQEYLQAALLESQIQQRYYVTLAGILMILSWIYYGMTRRPGALWLAIFTSIAIWYYPWRYYQRGKAIKRDLEAGIKQTLTTEVYAKQKSRINRIQPYYYLYTEEETFEVKENLYQQINIPQRVYLEYAPESCLILTIKRLD